MRILFVGEIVAKLGRKAVKEVLPELISSDSIDLVLHGDSTWSLDVV